MSEKELVAVKKAHYMLHSLSQFNFHAPEDPSVDTTVGGATIHAQNSKLYISLPHNTHYLLGYFLSSASRWCHMGDIFPNLYLISPQLSNWLGRNDDCHYTRCGVTFCSSGQKDNFLSQYRHWWGVFTIPKALSIPSIMFLLVTDEGLIIFLTFICTEKEENRKKTLFCLVEKILSPRWCSCRV